MNDPAVKKLSVDDYEIAKKCGDVMNLFAKTSNDLRLTTEKTMEYVKQYGLTTIPEFTEFISRDGNGVAKTNKVSALLFKRAELIGQQEVLRKEIEKLEKLRLCV